MGENMVGCISKCKMHHMVCFTTTYGFPILVHMLAWLMVITSWKLRKIRRKFVTRKQETMAMKIMAILSSVFLRRSLIFCLSSVFWKA